MIYPEPREPLIDSDYRAPINQALSELYRIFPTLSMWAFRSWFER